MGDERKNLEIQRTSYTHVSGADGLELAVTRIEPVNPGAAVGIVQLLHGMCDHKERYFDFMEYLAKRGYITIIHDHRGHGESIRDEKDLGYMYEVGYKGLVTDAHEITMEVKQYAEEVCENKLPITLLGHSMGSLVCRCYIRKYDKDIDKLCVLGCPSEKPGMKPGIMTIRSLEKIAGDRARVDLIAGLVMGSYEAKFRKEKVPHSWVNSDLNEVRKYCDDPLCNYNFTLNGYENLVKITMLTYRDGGHVMKNPDLPIRFYSGEDDPCAISKEDLRKAITFLKNQGYTNVRGKMYPGMRHEILNEPEKEKVYADIYRFLQS